MDYSVTAEFNIIPMQEPKCRPWVYLHVSRCNKYTESREASAGNDSETESITPEERTKGSDRYRQDNQGGDGVQVSVARRWYAL